MGDAARERAMEEARRAQTDFLAADEKYEAKLAEARRARREKFRKAQEAGLTHREIAEAAGLHHTRIGVILRED